MRKVIEVFVIVCGHISMQVAALHFLFMHALFISLLQHNINICIFNEPISALFLFIASKLCILILLSSYCNNFTISLT